MFYFLQLLQLTSSSLIGVPSNYPKFTATFELIPENYYGTVSQYTPLRPWINVGAISFDQANSSFLYQVNFSNNFQLINYCTYELRDGKITHNYLIYYNGSQIKKMSFDIDNLNFEGQFIFHYFYYNQSQNTLNLILTNGKDGNQQEQVIENFFFNGTTKMNVTIGGSLIQLGLTSFPGNLQFAIEEFSSFDNIYFQTELNKCKLQQSPNFDNLMPYSSNLYTILTPSSLVYFNYSVQFWNRINDLQYQQNGIIILLRINSQQRKDDDIEMGQDVIRIELEQITQFDIEIYLSYYSYDFPAINVNKEYILSHTNRVFIGKLFTSQLSKWHIIQFFYLSNVLTVKIIFPNLLKIVHSTQSINQFSFSQFTFIYGQINDIKFQGEIAFLQFYNCYKELTENFACHFSCETCDGPFEYNCLTCSIESKRIFDEQKQTCHCRPWTLELNFTECFIGESQIDMQEIDITEGYDQEFPEIICSYGYFLYNENQCIKCPRINGEYYKECYNCILNWQNWIYSANCQDQDNYLQYLFIDEQFHFCENCITISFEPSHYSFKYYLNHLNQTTYALCNYEYDPHTQRCLTSPANRTLYKGMCSQSINNFCIQCQNENDVLLLDQKTCQQCTIKNCKRCFSYTYQNDIPYSSLTGHFQKVFSISDDAFIGCALCQDGFIYDQSQNLCVPKIIILDNCLNYYFDDNSKFICLSTNSSDFSEGIEISNCQKLIQFCEKCIKFNAQNILCTKCQNGYYINNNLFCSQCPDYSLSCYLDYYGWSWVLGIQSFFISFYQFTAYFNLNQYFLYLNVKCQNYYYYDQSLQTCIEVIKNEYCLDYKGEFCDQCSNYYDYAYQISKFQSQCFQCSHQCQICIPNEIKGNYYFTQYYEFVNYSWYETSCIQTNFTENFIEQQTGLVRPLIQQGKRSKIQYKMVRTEDDIELQQVDSTEIKYLTLIQPHEIIIQIIPYNYTSDMQLENQYFNQISRLIYTNLTYQNYFFLKSLSLYDYSKVTFDNVTFYKQNLTQNLLITTEKQVDIVFMNTLFQFNFLFNDNYQLLSVSNCSTFQIMFSSLNNSILANSIVYQIILNNIGNESYFLIENFTLVNCVFTNSTLFFIYSQYEKQIDFQILNLHIINCTFSKFSFFQLNPSFGTLSFYLYGLQIIDSEMNQLTFLNQLNQKTQLIIDSLSISNSHFFQSTFFIIDSIFTLKKFSVTNSTFETSEVFNIFKKIEDQELIVDGVELYSVTFQQSWCIQIIEVAKSVIVSNIFIQNCNYLNDSQTVLNEIFSISATTIIISNYSAFNSILYHFKLSNSQYMKLFLIILNNSDIQSAFSYNEIQDQFFNRLQFIQSANNFKIILENFELIQLQFKDSVLLQFEEYSQNIDISIKNFNIYKNQILKTSQEQSYTSLLGLQILQKSQISIDNVQLINNFGIQRTKDNLFDQIQLIFIFSELSLLEITNTQLFNNYISNSSNGVINLFSSAIYIQNCTNINTNFMSSNVSSNLPNEFQKISLEALAYLFPIKSYGSLFKIKCSNLYINHLYSVNTTAQIGGLAYILLIQNGIFQINDSYIQNSVANLNTNSYGGSFYIDSSLSNIDLKMSNMRIENSFAFYYGGFIFLKPSVNQNNILMENIELIGIVSLSRSLISTEFQNDPEKNVLILSKIQVVCNYDDIITFSQFYPFANKDLLDKRFGSEGVFYIQNCKLYISNVAINYEILNEAVFWISSNYIIVSNLRIYFSQQRSQNIVYIQGLFSDINFYLKINSCLIKNQSGRLFMIQNFYKCEETTMQIIQNLTSQTYVPNILNNNCILSFWIDSDFSIQTILQIVSNNKLNNIIQMREIIINQIHNASYQSNLVLIQITGYTQIKLVDFYFSNNNCSFQSCLSLVQQMENISSKVSLKRSTFAKNLNSNNGTFELLGLINCDVSNTNFIENQALNYGAAFSSQGQFSKNFSNSYFVNNQANLQGGAIFSESLPENIAQNYFIENKANLGMNNFGVIPWQFQLVVHSTRETIYFNSSTAEKLTLFFPSGQELSNYFLFDKETLTFKSFNYSYEIIISNIFSEKQNLFDINDGCQIDFQIVLLNYSQLNNSVQKQMIYFTNGYSINMNDLIITKNPYEQTLTKMELKCPQLPSSSISLFIKTFKCQLGEILFQDQCIKCNGQQGYYSFNPLEGSCTKINTNQIKNNTENQLELNAGYWRPEIFNPIISNCQHKLENCLGGWNAGDSTCILGHLGALCEECDLYDIRGNGHFSHPESYECSICGNSIIILIKIFSVFVWVLLQINLAVKNTQFQNQKFLMLKVLSRYYIILFKKYQEQSGTLFKLIINYFQIISMFLLLQPTLNIQFYQIFNFVGNQTFSITFDLDCILYNLSTSISIIYLNTFYIIIISIVQYICYILITKLLERFNLGIFSEESIFCSLFYITLSTKANYINKLFLLSMPRKISGIYWISSNVSYEFYTTNHQHFLIYYVFPSLAFFSLLFPFFLGFFFYLNQNSQNCFRFKKKFGYLYNDYKQNSFYWELIKLHYKEIVMLIYVMFQQYIQIEFLIQFLFLSFYQYFQIQKNPYSLDSLNRYEQQIIKIIQFFLIFSLLEESANQQLQSLFLLCQIIKSLTLAYLLLISLRKLLINFLNQHYLVIDSIKLSINNKIRKFERLHNFHFIQKLLQPKTEILAKVNFNIKKVRTALKSGLFSSKNNINTIPSSRCYTMSGYQEIILKTATARSLI